MPEAEQYIAWLGQQIVEEVKPEDEHSEVRAIDGQSYNAKARNGTRVIVRKTLCLWACPWKDNSYDYRKETIEVLFQRIIQSLGFKECQVKGEVRNGAFVLPGIWLYQICFFTNYHKGKPLACIKDHLDCVRWRIPSG